MIPCGSVAMVLRRNSIWNRATPAMARRTHPVSDRDAMVRNPSLVWVGTLVVLVAACSEGPDAPTGSRVHPDGWLDPASGQFHGDAAMAGLAAGGATFCQNCHGIDYSGGLSGSDCIACHNARGAGECTACHGGHENSTGAPAVNLAGLTAPAARGVGAHTTMVEGWLYSDGFDCSQCHIKPEFVLAPGHIEPGEQNGLSRAEVRFSLLANPSGTASFDTSSATCSDVYCHGSFPGGVSNSVNFQSRWDTTFADTAGYLESSPMTRCGSCHLADSAVGWDSLHNLHVGVPSALDCSTCHGAVGNSLTRLEITDESLHVDGAVLVAFDSASGSGAAWDPVTRGCSGLDPGCHANTPNWPTP
jgi:hypothetical protein